MKRVSMVAVPILLLFLVVKTNVVSSAAYEVVERPTYSEGDFWIFIDGKGRISEWSFLREENEKYVFGRDGIEVVKDYSLMDISKTEGFPGPIVRFPLKKGNSWTYEYKVKSPTKKGKMNMIARYEAKDYEKVTVAAGTFLAFKITVAIDAPVGLTVHSLPGGVKEVGSGTYWYAPDVKQVIKADKGALRWYLELKEYKIR